MKAYAYICLQYMAMPQPGQTTATVVVPSDGESSQRTFILDVQTIASYNPHIKQAIPLTNMGKSVVVNVSHKAFYTITHIGKIIW